MKPDRKVGRHHLAFYRAWLHGLDIKEMADRYLESGMDVRRARATLNWLRDIIQQAALRHGRHGTARLLRLRIQIAVSSSGEAQPAELPTMAQFKEDFDPDGFYQEKELIEAYTEHYPASINTKAERKRRFVDRQIQALSWVEELLTTTPAPDDLVSAWFDKAIADRLALSGIPNIKGLLARINERGNRWWTTVPRLGKHGAERIIRWIQTYEVSLGELPLRAVVPARKLPEFAQATGQKLLTAIVPMDSLLVPAELDGTHGINRHQDSPRIDAKNDLQAINSWLSMKSARPNTQRAYRKEAERLLLWALMEKGVALSDLSVDNCASYRDWLSMLGRTEDEAWTFKLKQEDWVKAAGTGTDRHSACWRPFSGALSVKSVKQALCILNSMFDWLVKVEYLAFNPWSAVSVSVAENKDDAPDLELTRALSKAQWDYMLKKLDERADSPATRQLRFAMHFAYSTGMRRSELVSAGTGRLYSAPKKDGLGVRWMLKVLGKGNKWRLVPIHDDLLKELSDYLAYRGLNANPLSNPPDTALIAGIRSNDYITEDGLYKMFSIFFNEVAKALEDDGLHDDATKFRNASPHWVRHTRGSHLGSSGTPATAIQQLLGHSSVATTAIYTETNIDELWDATA